MLSKYKIHVLGGINLKLLCALTTIKFMCVKRNKLRNSLLWSCQSMGPFFFISQTRSDLIWPFFFGGTRAKRSDSPACPPNEKTGSMNQWARLPMRPDVSSATVKTSEVKLLLSTDHIKQTFACSFCTCCWYSSRYFQSPPTSKQTNVMQWYIPCVFC